MSIPDTNLRDRLEQIRSAYASARPSLDNIAWSNTHQDLGIVLAYLDGFLMVVERINTVACYASEEDTSSQKAALLAIGRDARALISDFQRKTTGA